MRTLVGNLGFMLLLALLAFAGWRIAGQMQAERYATVEPGRSLHWRPQYPQAMLALARRQLDQGEHEAAQATGRRLLAAEPLQGEAFRILAAVADHRQQPAQALALYRIAAHRAPRDAQAHAWLAQHYLQQGAYAPALAEIDRVLRMSPERAARVVPVLVEMARERDFAAALATALQANPPWRPAVLRALGKHSATDAQAEMQVLQALQAQGGLNAQEFAGWLDSLLAQGRWGQAYARWAGTVMGESDRLPRVYNGDFEQAPTGVGFDWRLKPVPGVLLGIEDAGGGQGMAARMRFLGRAVAGSGLEQPLMLPAGRFRMRLDVRAQGLRSGLGLQWQVVCADGAGVIARSDAIDGSFDWRRLDIDFTVPDKRCNGQWLRLVNPVAAGAGQVVVGELWIDGVAVESRS